MPELMEILGAALGGGVKQQLGRQIGADPQKTGNAIETALPMLLSGLTRNVSEPGGPESLHGALERDHDGSLLDNLGGLLSSGFGQVSPASANPATNGAGILGHVLGDRQDAAHRAVARKSGLNEGQVAQLMIALAPLVMSALGRVQRSKHLDAGGLASMLHGEQASVQQQQPGLMGLATQLLDRNRDGSALDDVMKAFGGQTEDR